MNNRFALLDKYASVRPHKDDDRTHDLIEQIGRMDKVRLDSQIYAGTPTVGHVFLMDSPGAPHCVLEMVMSMDGDSVSTLYHADDLFAIRQRLIDARAEIIDFLNEVADAPGDRARITCGLRGRPVLLRELTFQQLLDIAKSVLTKFFR